MIDDEGVARLRELCKDSAESFLSAAATCPTPSTATVLRAKAASWVTFREMLDEADNSER